MNVFLSKLACHSLLKYQCVHLQLSFYETMMSVIQWHK